MQRRTFTALPDSVRQYLIITGNYWAFTLTDGALRMLVVLYFHNLGYTPLTIASLFLFYEFFGVITNLFGGWLGAKWGLNRTMNIGLFLQMIALMMLCVPDSWLSIIWVMIAQAISGIAKDLNKMSAKSAIKSLVPHQQATEEKTLYRWVSFLTGSKNTLKGVGFFLGGLLLSTLGFREAMLVMLLALCIVWVISLRLLKGDLGKSKNKPKFKQLFAKNTTINYLSAARCFLFGARDIWFVIAAPIALGQYFGWAHWQVGSFFAIWIIAYGIVQALTPHLLGPKNDGSANAKTALTWIIALCFMTFLLVVLLWTQPTWGTGLIIGLLIFGGFFAVNSAIHSYLIVRYASHDGTSLDVGFYYMANAAGRLIGTILSGTLFQVWGLLACLIGSALFLSIAVGLTWQLHRIQDDG